MNARDASPESSRSTTRLRPHYSNVCTKSRFSVTLAHISSGLRGCTHGLSRALATRPGQRQITRFGFKARINPARSPALVLLNPAKNYY